MLSISSASLSPALPSPAEDRSCFLVTAQRLAEPVLTAAATGKLKSDLPPRGAPGHVHERTDYTHLEAVARLLCGLAPWLERASPEPDEITEMRRQQFRDQAVAGLAAIVDPASPDQLNFNRGRQPLVDAAFLCQALLRAPRQLAARLPADARRYLIAALESTRVIEPPSNNWLCFVGMVEAGLHLLGARHHPARIATTFRQLDAWYHGDGVYGDGPSLHFDYYNSFVIHPMLLDLAASPAVAASPADLSGILTMDTLLRRARRWAELQERLIAPDGSFPVLGRSVAYRAAAFHALAQLALWQRLPDTLAPAQVRGALAAVLRRTLAAPANYDDRGWLRIGLSGDQPSLGEHYISTGSLYLCSTGLLPLGLPADDAFWTGTPTHWTSLRAWSGIDLPADRALSE
jgi:Uncharacterized protein conserved in bacteria